MSNNGGGEHPQTQAQILGRELKEKLGCRRKPDFQSYLQALQADALLPQRQKGSGILLPSRLPPPSMESHSSLK